MKYFYYTILIFTVALVGCKKNQEAKHDTADISQDNQVQPQDIENPELEKKYRDKISEIIDTYQDTQTVGDLQEQLLAQRAPGKYLELHLQLAIAFDRISQGDVQAKSELDKIIDQTDWLN